MYLLIEFIGGTSYLMQCQIEKGDTYMSAANLSNGCVQRTYTAEQVAQILGISLRKAYGLCETTTDFKVMRLGKRCLRIHKESFDQWLNGQADLS